MARCLRARNPRTGPLATLGLRRGGTRLASKVVFLTVALFGLSRYYGPGVAEEAGLASKGRSLLDADVVELEINDSGSGSMISEDDDPLGSFPDAYSLFSEEDTKTWGWIFFLIGVMYTFWALAILCDEFFVPALELIEERWSIKPNVAGATLMAAGGSAPELATNFIGTFVSQSNVGFATIVGSAVFNVLFVIGMCAIFTDGDLPLTAWPLFRDCMWYTVCLSVLVVFYGGHTKDQIDYFESIALFCLYLIYVLICAKSDQLQAWFAERFPVFLDKDTVAPLEEGKTYVAEVQRGAHQRSVRHVQVDESDGHRLYKNRVVRSSSMVKKSSHTKEREVTFRRRSSATHLADLISEGNVDFGKESLEEGISKGNFIKFFRKKGMDNGDLDELFLQVDADGDGKVTEVEFRQWFDTDESVDERLAMMAKSEIIDFLSMSNPDANVNIIKKDVKNFVRDYYPTVEDEVESGLEWVEGTVSLDVFTTWHTKHIREVTWDNLKASIGRKSATTAKSAEPEEEEEELLEWPILDSPKGIIYSIFSAPLMIPILLTVPDVRNNDPEASHWFLFGCVKQEEKLYIFAFFLSILWIAVWSYLMLWWTIVIGVAWGIPDEVMGLTFIAAGTSIPDLLTSVAVARAGQGDMAVSSSIGSNIFDVAFGLPIPWLIYSLMNDKQPIDVTSDSLFLSVGLLLAMLIAVVLLIMAFGWKLTRGLGGFMFVLYFVFVAQDLLRRYV